MNNRISLRSVVIDYLKALDAISDANDRGMDDRGKRDTPSFRQWLSLDCAYTEQLERLRRAVKKPLERDT